MAIFKVVDRSSQSYENFWIEKKIRYILQPQKILSNYWGGFNFVYANRSIEEIIDQFYTVQKVWHKSNYMTLVHYVLSLDDYREYNITPFQLSCIAYYISKDLAEDQYQVIYAVHEDISHLHTHILVNPINLKTGLLLQTNQSFFNFVLNDVEFYLKDYHMWLGKWPLKLIR